MGASSIVGLNFEFNDCHKPFTITDVNVDVSPYPERSYLIYISEQWQLAVLGLELMAL